MTQQSPTWLKDKEAEARMEGEHLPFWRKLVQGLPPESWQEKTVLDFGCNRGGFLRMLYDIAPFKRGIGVDLVHESVEAAQQRRGARPIEYTVSPTLEPWHQQVDIAFSYEVIYLMADLDDHARQIKETLKPGGTYIAATGCHSDNPLWGEWVDIVKANSGATSNSRPLNDFAEAFHRNGFTVSARRLGFNDFVPIFLHREYFPTVLSSIDYYAQHIIVFSFTRNS